jgi:hypothetical protein
MKKNIMLGAVTVILVSATCWGLEDTPANRSREADRLISTNRIQEGMHQAIDHIAQILPIGMRKTFKDQMIANIDISTLERAMKEGMIKHFTVEEIQALANFGTSSASGSLVDKHEAYTLEVMRAFGESIEAALAKVSPEIVKWVSNDGRLGVRVKNLYTAIASKDLTTRYQMESVAIRHRMTFDGWKKDSGSDKPQRPSTEKIVQGELEKVCDCNPWEYDDGQQTLRCRILVLMTTEDSEGHRNTNRLLEMWESVDGEWYHGITDHHEWEDCPK